MLPRRELIVGLLLCLFVASFLRLSNLLDAPPGVHFDEAANGILAYEIGVEGERPIFISSYTGKEVLFFYLAGGVMRLVEESVWGLRLTAVFISLLTIATTYWLGVELCQNKRIALFATAFIAISFWHLQFSRLGFRAISQPLLQAITVAAWLRAARTGESKWFVFSGTALGLSAYTYLAARLFPLLLLLAAVPLFVKRPFNTRRLRHHLLLAGIAFLVLTPLLYYFWQNPAAFWVRINQVSTSGEQLTLWQGIGHSLQMIFLMGDPYIRFNLPFRPLFDPVSATFLVLGLLILTFKWPKLDDAGRTAVLLLLLAPFVMLLPTALATNEILPSNLRAIGAIPFIFYLPAVGLNWVLEHPWLRRLPAAGLSFTILLAILMIGGVETGVAYFQTWAAREDLFLETDGDLAAVAYFLDDLALSDETLFVASPHFQHPTVALLSQRYDSVKWLTGGDALVFPFRADAIVVYPAKSPPPDWAQPYLQTALTLADTPAFQAFQFENEPELGMQVPLNINFGDAAALQGYSLAPREGQAIPLLLFWEINGRPGGSFNAFVHLEDKWGYRWSQTETFAYPSVQWEQRDTLIQRVDIFIPPGTPLGTYTVRVGLFNQESGERLARFDENGRYAGDTYVIENIPIQPSPLPDIIPLPPLPLNLSITDGLTLVGSEVLPAAISTGEQLPIGLHWVAENPVPPIILRFELHKIGTVGGRILGHTYPVHDTYPFPSWETPQYVIDRHLLPLSDAIEPGEYTVTVRLLNLLEESIGAATLGQLTVEKTARQFRETAVSRPTEAIFGSEIRLHGYDIVPLNETQYELTLVWQALQQPKADYTVFVHLLMPDGSCTPCVWQQDIMPRQNQYPTSRWAAGEFVTDRYLIDVGESEAAVFPLEVGLYLPDSGIRLQVVSGDDSSGDAYFLEPIRRE